MTGLSGVDLRSPMSTHSLSKSFGLMTAASNICCHNFGLLHSSSFGRRSRGVVNDIDLISNDNARVCFRHVQRLIICLIFVTLLASLLLARLRGDCRRAYVIGL